MSAADGTGPSGPPMPAALERMSREPGIRVIETLVSWLLVGDTEVLKVKKPLRLPFIDYGSVARRRFCCAEELRLNRRHAPGLYLGLITLADGEPAVRMRRFDDALRLDRVCAAGDLGPERVAELAAVIADFHADAAIATPGGRFGHPQRILDQALENFTELASLLPERPDELAALARWTAEEFVRRQADFAERLGSGSIRECHGDLHLANLALIDGRVTPFDGIEFSEDLRWIDVASELAFPWADLLRFGHPELAARLVDEWLAITGDVDALTVFRFYAVYRALVRTKVAALTADRAGVDRWLEVAGRLIAPGRPTLTITCGPSGSGKSRASRARVLADARAATVRLRSDVERKRLFGLPARAASGSPTGGGIYTDESSERTYAILAGQARTLLATGWSVVVDASFLRRRQRETFRALAGELGCEFRIVLRSAPVAVLRERILRRRADASEATLAVLERQLLEFEPPGADETAYLETGAEAAGATTG